ncbi:hypothetical protein ES332_D11G083200v1 [Gossypium tomentosum]|uniref:Uncharacterized protein n=1 Tax=Gossypium tomentosum TaxID=34277 RepID=A0A5D2IL79_GOSTO|nr:hypothetical protein ES332_D11G083200v1 [Gossypium tomentosum]
MSTRIIFDELYAAAWNKMGGKVGGLRNLSIINHKLINIMYELRDRIKMGNVNLAKEYKKPMI